MSFNNPNYYCCEVGFEFLLLGFASASLVRRREAHTTCHGGFERLGTPFKEEREGLQCRDSQVLLRRLPGLNMVGIKRPPPPPNLLSWRRPACEYL